MQIMSSQHIRQGEWIWNIMYMSTIFQVQNHDFWFSVLMEENEWTAQWISRLETHLKCRIIVRKQCNSQRRSESLPHSMLYVCGDEASECISAVAGAVYLHPSCNSDHSHPRQQVRLFCAAMTVMGCGAFSCRDEEWKGIMVTKSKS